jgi:hypothetical protein
VNGHVYPQATRASMDSEYAQRPLLMERRGGRFHALSEAGAWKLEPQVDRTAVFADLDRDGDVDAVVAGLNQPLRVLRNDHDAADDWLVVEPRDTRAGVGNRHAVGAMVEVAAAQGVQRRWIVGGGPFQSNNAPEAHFGIPKDAGPLTVTVRFPDGFTMTEKVDAPGRRVVLDRAAR